MSGEPYRGDLIEIYRGYEIRKNNGKYIRRKTFRIYNERGEFMDGGNKSPLDAKRRIDFCIDKGVWEYVPDRD